MIEVDDKLTDLSAVEELIGNKGLVYVTGSHLTNTASEGSDTDYYGFHLPTKYELLAKDNNKGKTFKGGTYEVKYFMLPHLFNLLVKANPNVVEMFFKKPVYCSDECKPLADFLYENREALPLIDTASFVNSSYHMMKNNVKHLQSAETLGNRSFGKELYNCLKAYRYGMAVADGRSLEAEVFLTGKEYATQLGIKNLQDYQPDVLADCKLEDKLAELQSAKERTAGCAKDESLMIQLAEAMPLYY